MVAFIGLEKLPFGSRVSLKGRLGIELELGKEFIGGPNVDLLALGLQFFRALFLGGLLCPFAHDEQGGLLVTFLAT